MGQFVRQIAVVFGLTVILTFPVTVVSGAGSHRQADPDHTDRVAVTGGKGHVHGAVEHSEPARAGFVGIEDSQARREVMYAPACSQR